MPADLQTRLDRIAARLAEMEALEQAATKEKWFTFFSSGIGAWTVQCGSRWIAEMPALRDDEPHNAALIAALRNAAPGMLEYLLDDYERINLLYTSGYVNESYAEECLARLEAALGIAVEGQT